jgi:hypothetical protein
MVSEPTNVMGESPEKRPVRIDILIDADSPKTDRRIFLKIHAGRSVVGVTVPVSDLTSALLSQVG